MAAPTEQATFEGGAEVTPRHSAPQLIYGLDDRPPILTIGLLSVQHVLTMLGATVAVPTLVAASIGLAVADKVTLISNVLVCMGVATLLQVLAGSRLPIVQGSSFAFIPVFVFIGSTAESPERALAYISGAVLLGAFVQFGLGFTRVVGAIQRLLTPVVIGPVIILIGLSLFKAGVAKAAASWWLAAPTIALMFAFAYLIPSLGNQQVVPLRQRFLRGFSLRQSVRSFPVLLSVILMYGLCLTLSQLGVFASGDPGFIDVVRISAPTLSLSSLVLPWGAPLLDPVFFVAILAAYLVSTVESLGDYNACAHVTGDPLDSESVNRGIAMEGLGCGIASLLGGLPTTSYSENVGLIGITQIASRIVVVCAGVLLIVAGVFSGLGAILATIPDPMMGAMYCVLFGMITGVGLQQCARCDLGSFRNLSIMGFCIFMGLSFPEYVGALEEAPSTNAAGQALSESALQVGRDVFRAVGSSGMAVAAILGLVLDNVLPGESAERGV